MANGADIEIWKSKFAALHQGHYRRCRGEISALSAQAGIFGEVTVLPGDSNGLNWPTNSLPPVTLLPQSTTDIMWRTLNSRD